MVNRSSTGKHDQQSVTTMFTVSKQTEFISVARNGNQAQKNRPKAVVSFKQGGEADGARTRDLQRDRLAL